MQSTVRRVETLARIACQMRTCLHAGLNPAQALESSILSSFPQRLRQALSQGATMIREGHPISESLKPAAAYLPQFTFPFLQSGEASGQSAEAFEYLDKLCHQLLPILRLARQLWMIPLAIIGFGALLRVAIMIYFGAHRDAFNAVFDTAIALGAFIVGMTAVKVTTRGRQWLDLFFVAIPYVGQSIRAVSLGLFFQGFNFIYRAGASDIRSMLGNATRSVPNSHIRADLNRIAKALDTGQTLPEALAAPMFFNEATRTCLTTGAMVGRLEESLDRVTQQTTDALDSQLALTKTILAKLLGYLVIGSVIGTIQMYL